MPDRIVRAAILSSDAVNKLSWPAEVFYRRLLSVVDDFGRYDGRPSIVRAHLYPLKLDRVSDPDVCKWMRECAEAGLVRIYHVEERQFLEVQKFDQRMRAKNSKWPQPPTSADTCQHVSSNAPVFGDEYGDGDGDGNVRKPAGSRGAHLVFELPFDSEEFAAGWTEWISYRKELKKPVTATMGKSQLDGMAAMGEARSLAMIRHTIRMGWQGLREPEPQKEMFPGGKEGRGW